MSRHKTLSIELIRASLAPAIKQGINIPLILEKANISSEILSTDGSRVSVHNFTVMVSSLIEAMNDEAVGFFKAPYIIGTWALMAHAIIGCDTLGHALRRYSKFYHIVDKGLIINLAQKDEEIVVTLVPRKEDANCELYPYITVFFSLLNFLSWLIDKRFPVTKAGFTHQKPIYVDEISRIFQGRALQFEQKESYFSFNSSVCAEPIVQTEITLKKFLKNPVLGMFTHAYSNDSYTIKTRSLLDRNLKNMPSLITIAESLNLHPQTYRRRLEEEGTTFSLLKAEIKRDAAIHYLTRRTLSTDKISERLGFSDTNSFVRAFKSWVGVTPSVYRKKEKDR